MSVGFIHEKTYPIGYPIPDDELEGLIVDEWATGIHRATKDEVKSMLCKRWAATDEPGLKSLKKVLKESFSLENFEITRHMESNHRFMHAAFYREHPEFHHCLGVYIPCYCQIDPTILNSFEKRTLEYLNEFWSCFGAIGDHIPPDAGQFVINSGLLLKDIGRSDSRVHAESHIFYWAANGDQLVISGEGKLCWHVMAEDELRELDMDLNEFFDHYADVIANVEIFDSYSSEKQLLFDD